MPPSLETETTKAERIGGTYKNKENLRNTNLLLLATWAWKMLKSLDHPSREVLWKRQACAAYYSRCRFSMSARKRPSRSSPIWKDICKDIETFWNCISFNLGNGDKIRFWNDG